ncbi:hypothetical protein Tco_0098602 [Tanacetum coccineum]
MKTPMSSDTKLTKDEECESVDSTKYRGMIGTGYREKNKNKDKTGQNRARDQKEREKTSPTVLSGLIRPARDDVGVKSWHMASK